MTHLLSYDNGIQSKMSEHEANFNESTHADYNPSPAHQTTSIR